MTNWPDRHLIHPETKHPFPQEGDTSPPACGNGCFAVFDGQPSAFSSQQAGACSSAQRALFSESQGRSVRLPFPIEQKALGCETASEARQAVVAADDPVAGSEDRNGIGAAGVCHSAYGRGEAEAPGQFAVRNRVAIGNFEQLCPDFLLERRAHEEQGDVERMALSGKVFVKLMRSLAGDVAAARGVFRSERPLQPAGDSSRMFLDNPIAKAETPVVRPE